MPTPKDDPPFKILRQLNAPEADALARLKHRLIPAWSPQLRGGGRLIDALIEALAERAAIDLKELCEGLEFYARVRRRARAPIMADLCCGHGFNGLLFAALEREVTQIHLIDRRRPESATAIYEAFCAVAPWVEDKVIWREEDIHHAALPEGCAILGVHACGARTDACLDIAARGGGPVAVMPCCYGRVAGAAPRPLREAFGGEVAADIHRTYRLEAAGYEVAWSYIPKRITPMNRVLIGRPRP
ncbi:hypothetical protein KKF91_08875 [Myxococcota bacterium]|nr:hypothetical protein [Myxococcota bacterium]MBU1430654.1 hypothetical protein [Myxococcota bacterium]MBU1898610.1 hypothetical protein [Myxococcota bacterium]